MEHRPALSREGRLIGRPLDSYARESGPILSRQFGNAAARAGLRGGIAVALALSLPASPYREALVTAAHGIAIFTMVVQGLSLGRVASRLYPRDDDRSKD
jgi:NhaP-type Na+/H+ or K+/H+ antiporter